MQSDFFWHPGVYVRLDFWCLISGCTIINKVTGDIYVKAKYRFQVYPLSSLVAFSKNHMQNPLRKNKNILGHAFIGITFAKLQSLGRLQLRQIHFCIGTQHLFHNRYSRNICWANQWTSIYSRNIYWALRRCTALKSVCSIVLYGR